jgi:hypothetical protein
MTLYHTIKRPCTAPPNDLNLAASPMFEHRRFAGSTGQEAEPCVLNCFVLWASVFKPSLSGGVCESSGDSVSGSDSMGGGEVQKVADAKDTVPSGKITCFLLILHDCCRTNSLSIAFALSQMLYRCWTTRMRA